MNAIVQSPCQILKHCFPTTIARRERHEEMSAADRHTTEINIPQPPSAKIKSNRRITNIKNQTAKKKDIITNKSKGKKHSAVENQTEMEDRRSIPRGGGGTAPKDLQEPHSAVES